MKFKFKKGFTLIELIAVIAVMGTLVGVSATSYSGYREMAEREDQKMSIQLVKNAVDNYYSANEIYPTDPIAKQPSPDTTGADGTVYKGYSAIDLNLLIKERFLQEAPKLKDGQVFVVHYNGLVTIEENHGDSFIVEGGAVVVERKTGDSIDFVVYTDNSNGKNATSVTVVEINDKGTAIGTAVTAIKGSNGQFTGAVKLKDGNPGPKQFRATIKYGTQSVVLESSIQYAMSAESITSAPYWFDKNITKGDKPVPLPVNNITIATDSITINWNTTDVGIESFGYIVTDFEITKKWTEGNVNHTVVITPAEVRKNIAENGGQNRRYVDTEIKGGITYTYEITAISNSLRSKNVLTVNPGKKTLAYVDTPSYFYNITKNDYKASYGETIMFNVGDKEGIKNVYVHVGTVKNGTLVPVNKEGTQFYTTYKLDETTNRRYAEKKKITDAYNKQVEIDVYTYFLPVEVADDYIVYWIEIEDQRTHTVYAYYNPTIQQGTTETVEQVEDRRTVVSTTKPSVTAGSKDDKWSVMRGLVKIFDDPYVDDSKIDKTYAGTKFKLYNGKVYLP